MTIRVVIADDQQLIRAGFKMILSAEPDIEVVGEANTGSEAVALTAELRPDVILMDIRMPDMDGIEATRRILAQDHKPPPSVLILTTFDLDEYVYEALRAGASGFLLERRTGSTARRRHPHRRPGRRTTRAKHHAPTDRRIRRDPKSAHRPTES